MADLEQLLDLLSECSFVIGLLEAGGDRAVARRGESVELDGYPSSSMPDSAIARGRVSRPVEQTVIKRAGGKDAGWERLSSEHPTFDREAGGLDLETTPDTWEARHDPIGTAVNRMLSQSRDAANRLASAQLASFAARGLSGGQVFGIIGDKEVVSWPQTVDKLRVGLKALTDNGRDLPDDARALLSQDQKAGLRRMTRELEDGKNRLRTAERAMREALPEKIADVSREVCKSCGTPKDIVTWWGAHPNNWIKGEAACRACVTRTSRNSKGKAS